MPSGSPISVSMAIRTAVTRWRSTSTRNRACGSVDVLKRRIGDARRRPAAPGRPRHRSAAGRCRPDHGQAPAPHATDSTTLRRLRPERHASAMPGAGPVERAQGSAQPCVGGEFKAGQKLRVERPRRLVRCQEGRVARGPDRGQHGAKSSRQRGFQRHGLTVPDRRQRSAQGRRYSRAGGSSQRRDRTAAFRARTARAQRSTPRRRQPGCARPGRGHRSAPARARGVTPRSSGQKAMDRAPVSDGPMRRSATAIQASKAAWIGRAHSGRAAVGRRRRRAEAAAQTVQSPAGRGPSRAVCTSAWTGDGTGDKEREVRFTGTPDRRIRAARSAAGMVDDAVARGLRLAAMPENRLQQASARDRRAGMCGAR